MSRPKLITVSGPTAIGKTAFAVSLAKRLDCSLLSSDARQCYKEMQIGTAVPNATECDGVPHYFLQHKSIHDTYSVGDFEKEALLVLQDIYKNKKVAILVGGSNLYTDAVVHGLDDFPEVSKAIADQWQQAFEEKGLKHLQDELARLDPTYFAQVDTQNHMRIMRALSVCSASGLPYSSFIGKQKEKRPFDVISIELTMPRELLYERINMRVDNMVKAGLVDEVKSLLPHKALNALQTVGYRELFPYFDGHTSLEDAVAEIKKNTRRFAKRQLTWLRNHACMHQLAHDTKVDKALLAQLGLEEFV
jgi:tRNA dimethylallyltransferase